MKKGILLVIPLMGLLLSCSGRTGEKSKANDPSQEKIEAIDKSVKKLESTIDSSKTQIDTLQSEIDGILKDI